MSSEHRGKHKFEGPPTSTSNKTAKIAKKAPSVRASVDINGGGISNSSNSSNRSKVVPEPLAVTPSAHAHDERSTVAASADEQLRNEMRLIFESYCVIRNWMDLLIFSIIVLRLAQLKRKCDLDIISHIS